MSASPDSRVWTPMPDSVCARCAHAGGLLGWLEAALPPLPFAMCFSAAEERPGGILALPNGFLKTLVAKRYSDELARYADSVGLAHVEIVVDPTVSAPPADEHRPAERCEEPARPVREQPPGLTTRFFAERGFWQLSPLAAGRTRQLDDLRGQLTVEAGAQGACGTYEAMVLSGLLAVWGDGPRTEPTVECGLRRLSSVLGLAWGGRTATQLGCELVLLDEQHRFLWDETQILEAREMLERSLALQGAGPYVVQAAIADLHTQEPRDWDQITRLYRRLEDLTGSPIVTVNRAVALAEIEGPTAALALLDDLDLDSYLDFHSTRADFLRRLGRDDEARAAYARALQLAETGNTNSHPADPPAPRTETTGSEATRSPP